MKTKLNHAPRCAASASPHVHHQPSIAHITEFLDRFWESTYADRWKSSETEDYLFRSEVLEACSRSVTYVNGWEKTGLSGRSMAIALVWYSLAFKGDDYCKAYKPKEVMHELRKTVKESQP